MWLEGQFTGRGRGEGVMVSGYGLLLLLCVARAVVASDQDIQVQRSNVYRSQRSEGKALPLIRGYSHQGHDKQLSHGHRLYHSRSRLRHQNLFDRNPFNINFAHSSNLKRTSRRDAYKKSKPTDCSIYQQSHHAQNRTHVESLQDVNSMLCRYYGPWSRWRPCNRRCQQRRVRRCQVAEQCGNTKLREHRTCRRRSGRCSSLSKQAVGDFRGQNRQIERVLFDVIYTDWSSWGACTRSCKQRRRRRCTVREVCQRSFIQESRRCSVPGSRCERRHKSTSSPSEADSQNQEITAATASPILPTSTAEMYVPDQGSKTKPNVHRKKGDYRPKQEKEEDREITTDDIGDILSAAQKKCGIRPAAKRGSYRVVGGQEAQRLSWPWQMAILTRWDEQYCAGTLIAPQWVLTAAHCVRKKGRRRRIIVRAGEHNLMDFEGSEHDVKPEREYPHPDFDYVTITNDIALVRLKTPLEDHSHPGYACLPEPGFTPDRDSLCYILGWGKRRNTHLFGAETLHEAQVPLVSHRRCQRVFDYHINKTQICAGYKRGGTDACAGDSGGPLLCPKTQGGVTRWFLTGITSYGEGCGRRGKYGIYTRVTSYRKWISGIIG